MNKAIQWAFTCSRSTAQTPEKGQNVSKVNKRDTAYTSVIKSFKMTVNSKQKFKLKTGTQRYTNIKSQNREKQKPSFTKE